MLLLEGGKGKGAAVGVAAMGSRLWRRHSDIIGPAMGLVLVMALFGFLEPQRFLSLYNIQTVANQSVIVALGAIGMTLVMVSGGIDLSVGSAIAFATVVVAKGLNAGLPPVAAVGAGIVACALLGTVNGLLVTGLRIVPFIATLGMLEVVRGASQWLAAEQKVNAPFTWINQMMSRLPHAPWMVFSPGVWVMVLGAVFMAWFLKWTVLGRHAFAIGSNENTARLCGIPVARSKLGIYSIAGAFAGMAGVAQFSRLGVGDPTVAVGRELDIVAAVVIGGGSLSGGKGSVVGAVIGAFIMSFLRNGCTMVGVSSPMQKVVIGGIIIVAVAIDQWRARR